MTGGSQGEPRYRLVRQERGWDLSISRRGVSFRRFSHALEDLVAGWPGQAAPPLPGGPARRSLYRLLPLLLGAGSITAGVLAAPVGSTGRAYSVSMPVPDRPVYAARLSSTSSVGRYAAPARKHRAVAEDEEPAASMGNVTASAMEDLGSGTNASTKRRYMDRALRSGEMQSWQTGNVRYFLVAGDLRRDDDKACRELSLLARPDGGADSVRHFERCRAAE